MEAEENYNMGKWYSMQKNIQGKAAYCTLLIKIDNIKTKCHLQHETFNIQPYHAYIHSQSLKQVLKLQSDIKHQPSMCNTHI
jgi:hypothetical protein